MKKKIRIYPVGYYDKDSRLKYVWNDSEYDEIYKKIDEKVMKRRGRKPIAEAEE